LIVNINVAEIANQEGLQKLEANPQEPKGLTLLKKNCYQCHNPNTTSHEEILAPPLFGIKSRYKKAFPESDQFINSMIEFIENPKEEKALMKGPIKRFGVMKKPVISQEDLKIVVEYIESNDLEKPIWFEQQHKNQGNNKIP
jgi:cytochrome c2